jgi:hypothetical protein
VWNGGFGPHAPFQSGSSCQPGWAELPGPHDLGADAVVIPLEEGVVDSTAAAGLPPPSGGHPRVQLVAGVTEVCVAALALAGAEPVERDGEVLDVDA